MDTMRLQDPHPAPAIVCMCARLVLAGLLARGAADARHLPGYWSTSSRRASRALGRGLNMTTAPRRRARRLERALTRLRLLTALRIEEAARHGAADTELVLCANEVRPTRLG